MKRRIKFSELHFDLINEFNINKENVVKEKLLRGSSSVRLPNNNINYIDFGNGLTPYLMCYKYGINYTRIGKDLCKSLYPIPIDFLYSSSLVRVKKNLYRLESLDWVFFILNNDYSVFCVFAIELNERFSVYFNDLSNDDNLNYYEVNFEGKKSAIRLKIVFNGTTKLIAP